MPSVSPKARSIISVDVVNVATEEAKLAAEVCCCVTEVVDTMDVFPNVDASSPHWVVSMPDTAIACWLGEGTGDVSVQLAAGDRTGVTDMVVLVEVEAPIS